MSTRQCSVYECHNSGRKLEKWRETVCSIHQRLHRSCICPEPFRLLPFPTQRKDPDARQKWIRLVGRKSETNRNKIWVPNADSRICSIHFVDSEPTQANPYPTLHMGTLNTSSTPKPRKAPTPRRLVDTTTKKVLAKNSTTEKNSTDTSVSSFPVHIHVNHDHDYDVSQKQECKTCECCSTKDAQIKRLKQMNTRLQLDVVGLKLKLKSQSQFSHNKLLKDSKVLFYTGLRNRKAFEELYSHMAPKLQRIRFWRGPSGLPKGVRRFTKSPRKFGPARKLGGRDLLLMTLMKLRLGLLNEDLADRFNVSTSTCSRVLTTTIKFLSSELKCLIFKPAEEVLKANLPRRFQSQPYQNVRHIIDCTEVFIETPKNLEVQAQTWSNYKHHQTVKCLVSITPTGHFNFVSEAWGGRISDKQLTQVSGFLDTLSRDEVVLADRGFPIAEDVALRHAHLLIPPGRRGTQQMTQAQILKTKQIANPLLWEEC
ncbi:hypothetical protein Bbelb_239730 [Branchiostoma belcheri]|nr:hypothetical protein Bbelb_239730 [Branchiostoma belcheri]